MRCSYCQKELNGNPICPRCGTENPQSPQPEPSRKDALQKLRPRSPIEFFLIGLMVLAICAWGYRKVFKKSGTQQADFFAAPEEIDIDLIRIHRTAEEETASQMIERWQERGAAESVAAVYEFSAFPYKPVFFLGAAKGAKVDRQVLLEEEMLMLQGTTSSEDKTEEVTRDGVSFLCASFQRGRGLVGMSAVCVWDDEKTAGYGVRLAGGAIRDTVQYTAAARKALTQPAPESPFADSPRVTREKQEPEMNRATRDIVASLLGYNCERFRTFLPPGAEDLFHEHIGKELLDTMKDPVERVCFVLSVSEFPHSESMMIVKKREESNRVMLELHDRERHRSPVELSLLNTSSGWKVDPDWAIKRVQDHPVRLALLQFASNQQGMAAYTDDPETKGTYYVLEFVPGMADTFSEPGKVHARLSEDQRFICGSALSLSGELFLIRLDDQKRIAYLRSRTLPYECPVTPLSPQW